MKQLMGDLLKLQTLEFGEKSGDAHAATVAELRGKIPAPILAHYDRLRVRGKKGLVALRHQVCTGCHMSVPLATVMTLKHGHDIQLCDTCGRYLYLPDEEENLPPPAAAPARRGRKPKQSAKPG